VKRELEERFTFHVSRITFRVPRHVLEGASPLAKEEFMDTSRAFSYTGPAEAVRDYLTTAGYETDALYDRAGETIIGFTIRDTTIQVSYALLVDGRAAGEPMISLRNSLITTGGDQAKAERSLQLYHKLYRRFRKRAKG
jgi:hypothetical protein